jgi:hypothetical protein
VFSIVLKVASLVVKQVIVLLEVVVHFKRVVTQFTNSRIPNTVYYCNKADARFDSKGVIIGAAIMTALLLLS